MAAYLPATAYDNLRLISGGTEEETTQEYVCTLMRGMDTIETVKIQSGVVLSVRLEIDGSDAGCVAVSSDRKTVFFPVGFCNEPLFYNSIPVFLMQYADIRLFLTIENLVELEAQVTGKILSNSSRREITTENNRYFYPDAGWYIYSGVVGMFPTVNYPRPELCESFEKYNFLPEIGFHEDGAPAVVGGGYRMWCMENRLNREEAKQPTLVFYGNGLAVKRFNDTNIFFQDIYGKSTVENSLIKTQDSGERLLAITETDSGYKRVYSTKHGMVIEYFNSNHVRHRDRGLPAVIMVRKENEFSSYAFIKQYWFEGSISKVLYRRNLYENLEELTGYDLGNINSMFALFTAVETGE